jgi:phenylalanyl-tRNA synthetase beta chain
MESAVSESTTSIIWESACFDPISVRLTAQRLGLRTDASTRYEKSLDPLLTKKVFTRVLDYMAFLGKDTTLDSQATYFLPSSVNTLEITLSYEFLNKKIGVFVPESEVKKILSHLGFVIKKEE